MVKGRYRGLLRRRRRRGKGGDDDRRLGAEEGQVFAFCLVSFRIGFIVIRLPFQKIIWLSSVLQCSWSCIRPLAQAHPAAGSTSLPSPTRRTQVREGGVPPRQAEAGQASQPEQLVAHQQVARQDEAFKLQSTCLRRRLCIRLAASRCK